jgi:hypothetical protein
MSRISNTHTLSIVAAPTGVPTWRQGMAVGEWKQISGTSISTCPISVQTYPARGNTGPSSKVEAWISWVLNPNTSFLYSPASGGHKDYAGSEVDAINLSANAPVWTEVNASCTASSLPLTDQETGLTNYYQNKPVSRHQFNGASWNQVRNRVMIHSGAAYPTGYLLTTVDGFNPANNTWDAAGTYSNVPGGVIGIDYPSCHDPVTGDIYKFAANNVFKWTSTTNVWSNPASGPWAQAAHAIFDSTRNRILIFGDPGYTGVASASHIYTVGTTTSAITFNGSGASSIQGQNYCGGVYEPTLDRFLVRTRTSGGTVYQIHPTTWEVTPFTTTGGSSIPAAVAGVFHRFLYVPALTGIVFAPSYSSNLWFLRTS